MDRKCRNVVGQTTNGRTRIYRRFIGFRRVRPNVLLPSVARLSINTPLYGRDPPNHLLRVHLTSIAGWDFLFEILLTILNLFRSAAKRGPTDYIGWLVDLFVCFSPSLYVPATVMLAVSCTTWNAGASPEISHR